MKLVVAPEMYDNSNSDLPSVFLGGGITNVKLWQEKLIDQIKHLNCVIYNPRRKSFDIKDPTQSEIQIRWEYNYLAESDIVIFYFSSETLCPITLFELGARLAHNSDGYRQTIYIYCEPDYQRKFDVDFQTKLAQETYINAQEAIYKIMYHNHKDCEDVFNRIETMRREGPQKHGFDVTCFDDYNKFVVALCEKIRSYEQYINDYE